MSLTTAFHEQYIAALRKQTEEEYTNQARALLLTKVYPPLSTWFKRKHTELIALSVQNARLREPTGSGQSESALWQVSTALSFVPAINDTRVMTFSAKLCTRTHNTYTWSESNREISLRLTFGYWRYGEAVQGLYLSFPIGAVLGTHVYDVLDSAWSHLDQFALAALGSEFWSDYLPPSPFRRELQLTQRGHD